MKKGRCCDCAYWEEWDDEDFNNWDMDEKTLAEISEFGIGRCKCNPPYADDLGTGYWPDVRGDFWCGKFEER